MALTVDVAGYPYSHTSLQTHQRVLQEPGRVPERACHPHQSRIGAASCHVKPESSDGSRQSTPPTSTVRAGPLPMAMPTPPMFAAWTMLRARISTQDQPERRSPLSGGRRRGRRHEATEDQKKLTRQSLSAVNDWRREQMTSSSYERDEVHRHCHFSLTPSLGGGRARVDSLDLRLSASVARRDRPRRPSLPSAGPAIGRAVLDGSSVGARVREERSARST